jgi:hypothetical protein
MDFPLYILKYFREVRKVYLWVKVASNPFQHAAYQSHRPRDSDMLAFLVVKREAVEERRHY